MVVRHVERQQNHEGAKDTKNVEDSGGMIAVLRDLRAFVVLAEAVAVDVVA